MQEKIWGVGLCIVVVVDIGRARIAPPHYRGADHHGRYSRISLKLNRLKWLYKIFQTLTFKSVASLTKYGDPQTFYINDEDIVVI